MAGFSSLVSVWGKLSRVQKLALEFGQSEESVNVMERPGKRARAWRVVGIISSRGQKCVVPSIEAWTGKCRWEWLK